MMETSIKLKPLTTDSRIRLKRLKFLKSGWFIFTVFFITLAVHVIFIGTALLVFYLTNGVLKGSFAIAITLFLSIVFLVAVVITFILIKSYKIKESFYIVTSSTLNIVFIVIMVPIVALFIALSTANSYIPSFDTGYYIYWSYMAIDIAIIILVFLDFFLYVQHNETKLLQLIQCDCVI